MKYICSGCGAVAFVSVNKYTRIFELFCSVCKGMAKWYPVEWPDIPEDREIWFNGDTYWHSSHTSLCFQCKTNQTRWVSISFEGHLCTPVCAEAAWNEFFGMN